MSRPYPFISVVMTAYNAEKYIGLTIESILKQTYPHFEFLIINDGSQDSTQLIIESYAAKDKRIRFFVQPENLGIPLSSNEGIRRAQGDYIARTDADDISLPDRFRKQVAFLNANKDVGLCGGAAYIYDSSGRKKLWRAPLKHCDIQKEVFFSCPILHSTVMGRRAVFFDFGLRYAPEYQYAHDYDLWTKMIRVVRLENLADPLAIYRNHDSQVSTKYSAKQAEEGQDSRKNLFEYFFIVDDRLIFNYEFNKHVPCKNQVSFDALWSDVSAFSRDNLLKPERSIDDFAGLVKRWKIQLINDFYISQHEQYGLVLLKRYLTSRFFLWRYLDLVNNLKFAAKCVVRQINGNKKSAA